MTCFRGGHERKVEAMGEHNFKHSRSGGNWEGIIGDRLSMHR